MYMYYICLLLMFVRVIIFYLFTCDFLLPYHLYFFMNFCCIFRIILLKGCKRLLQKKTIVLMRKFYLKPTFDILNFEYLIAKLADENNT